MSRAESIRLDSWKEIASYLGRDVRTVRRWEEERGLPVHRLPGGKRGAVYALRNEIDTWLFEVNEGREKNSGRSIDEVPLPTAEGKQDLWGTAGRRAAPISETVVGDEALSYAPESKPISKGTKTTSRQILRIVVGVITIFAAVLSASWVWIHRSREASLAIGPNDPLSITSVSPILPQRNQTIVIRGSGFGLHTGYSNADIPFIAIRDKTAGWAAGRIIPQNWDEVTLDVKSWQDKQIVIRGFSGAYGVGNWELAPGDEIEIAVWNPQSGVGPALYRLTVAASPAN